MWGKLKGLGNSNGAQAALVYNGLGQLTSISFADSNGNTAAQFIYTYYTDPDRAGLMASASQWVSGVEVRRALYDYYLENELHGPERTLKSADVLGKDEGGVWESIGKQRYRYYTETAGVGAKYGIKLWLDDNGTVAAEAAGFDLDAALDEDLFPYAINRFEFNAESRVTKETVRNGEDYLFGWMTNSADPAFTDTNTWYRQAIETRPDGSKMKVYTNKAGVTILTILEDPNTGDKWYEYFVYDSENRLLDRASSAAVQAVVEPAAPNGTLTVTLKAGDGLINVKSYYPADDFPNGRVKGYLESEGVKKGSAGQVAIIRKQTYDTQTINGVSIHPIKEELVFQTAGVPDAQASKTNYARTWYTDSFQVKQITTTLPIVSVADHGTGLEEKTDQIFDLNGFNTWSRDARGIITRQFFDEATGAVIRIIEDADPAQLENPPTGWVAPAFGGENLITDIINDRLGRSIRDLGPEHFAVVDGEKTTPCEPGTVGAKKVRTVDFTVYLCPRHQTWRARGYVTDYGTPNETWHIEGPVNIEQRDALTNTVDQISAIATCDCGPLSMGSFGPLDPYTKLPKREHWSAWSHTIRDVWGRDLGERAYFEIPDSGDGFKNENYYENTRGYDSMNRRNRLVLREATIIRTVFDIPGKPLETWIGTNDTGATDSDPGNGGANGNNMKPVRLEEYDDGNAGGNQNRTKVTLPVDDNAANDRVTDFLYDFRNREIDTRTSDGTTLFIAVTAYNNVDDILSQTAYHTTPVAANRIAFSEQIHDLRSRVFEEKIYGVDPATGNLTHALVAGTWFDPDDNIISQTPAGRSSATKTQFNGRNLPVITYEVVPGTLAAGAPANDVSDDIVVEQIETGYDGASNPISTVTKMRLPDATGKGALGSATGAQPRARVSWMEDYFDGVGRSRFGADFGTNGGIAPIRSEVPPTPSETVLVSETKYNKAGYQDKTIATDGVIDITNFDALGQPIQSIEACGTNDYRDQLFGWHPSGLMEFLILENPDTGQQVTQWLFGSTLDTSEVAQNGVIVGKVYPTGESSTNTVNRQGEVNTHTQPNGTNHEYTRNKVGAVIHDAVTTLGPDIDDTVLRISSVFNNRGLIELISSFDNATIGAGNVINQVKRVYDAFNQVIEDQQEHSGAVDANTPAVTYGFTDGSNNTLRPTSVSTPFGQQTDINYGAATGIDQTFNRPTALRVAGESDNLVDYEYAGLAMVTNVTYPGPDVELALATAGAVGDAGDSLTGFDAFNRIIDMPWRKKSTSAVLAQIGYGYDEASRRKWRQDLTPQANNVHDQFFGYDKLSQVKSAARGTLNNNRTEIGAIPTEEEGWEYDETGNWREYQRAEDGTQTVDETRTHNTSNQIKAVDGTNAGIAYDTNGNMTRVPTGSGLQGPPRTLRWDAWDRMVDVRKKSDNSLIAKYAYDGLTRRTTKTDSNDKATHFYYNLDWRAVEERIDASTNPSNVYYWGAQSRWDLIRRDRDTNGNGTLDETLYCLRDAMDPVAVVDSSGAVQERFQYTAFGEVAFLATDYSVRNSSDFDWEFLFHGEFRDEETGYYNYGFRYYVAEFGRWLSRDPIGESELQSVYKYLDNQPIASTDFLGLIPVSQPRISIKPKSELKVVNERFREIAIDFVTGASKKAEYRYDITDPWTRELMKMPPYDRMRNKLREMARKYCNTQGPLPSSGKWDVRAVDWGDEGGLSILQAIRDGANYVFGFELRSLGGVEGEFKITNLNCSTCDLGYSFEAGPGEFRFGSLTRVGERGLMVKRIPFAPLVATIWPGSLPFFLNCTIKRS